MSTLQIDWKKLLDSHHQLDSFLFQAKKLTYDQTVKERQLALIVELCECANEAKSFKFWSNQSPNRERTLDEYADVIHFILSTVLWKKIDISRVVFKKLPLASKEEQTDRFFNLIKTFSFDVSDDEFIDWIQRFMDLGSVLGFSLDEIYSAYLKKRDINIERQNSGY